MTTAQRLADALRAALPHIDRMREMSGGDGDITAANARAALAAYDAERASQPERYRVRWESDSDADTPEDAAREAWADLRRRGSIANIIMVRERDRTEQFVDLGSDA